jgi:hypothetical protein
MKRIITLVRYLKTAQILGLTFIHTVNEIQHTCKVFAKSEVVVAYPSFLPNAFPTWHLSRAELISKVSMSYQQGYQQGLQESSSKIRTSQLLEGV